MAAIVSAEQLQKQLAEARRGFDAWQKAHGDALDEAVERSGDAAREGGEKLKELRTELTRVEELQLLLEKQRAELDAAEREISQLQAEEEKWPSKLRELRQNLDSLTAKNEKDSTELEEEEAVKQRKADALSAVREKYRKYFGLKFEHEIKDHIKMVFNNIDSRDPTREFFLVLHVTRTYTVNECCPPLLQLEEFVAEVNANNNFSQFVQKIRRAFQATCELHT